MPRLPAHHHLVGLARNPHLGIAGQAFPKRHLGVELRAGLVEHRDLQVGAQRHGARIRRDLAQSASSDQRRLADAVRPDEGHPVAALHGQGEVLDDARLAEGLATCLSRRSPSCPIGAPQSSSIAAVPCRRIIAARSSRRACSARTRPWLRLRRALMPSTAQRASALILRSILWRCWSSSSQILSRQASNSCEALLGPAHRAPVEPERRAGERAQEGDGRARSGRRPARVACSSSSSQPIASMSRWLVGSSSSISSGSAAISRASAARRRSPPEAVAHRALRVEPQPLARTFHPVQLARVQPVGGEIAQRLEAAHVGSCSM